MNIKDLTDTKESFPIVYSMEDSFNFQEMSNYVINFVNKITNVFNNKKLTPTVVSFFESGTATNLLKKYPLYNLEHFTVITPEYITGDLIEYYKVLEKVLLELSTIQKRVLTPLEQWVAYSLSDPNYTDKVWINTPLGETAIKDYSEQIHKYFNTSIGDGVTNQLFIDTYKTPDRLKEATKILDDLSKLAIKLLDGKITKQVETIAVLINKLIQKKDITNKINNLPFEKMKPIGELTLLAAKELELLAIVLYQVKIASYAHEETIKKINNQLK